MKHTRKKNQKFYSAVAKARRLSKRNPDTAFFVVYDPHPENQTRQYPWNTCNENDLANYYNHLLPDAVIVNQSADIYL